MKHVAWTVMMVRLMRTALNCLPWEACGASYPHPQTMGMMGMCHSLRSMHLLFQHQRCLMCLRQRYPRWVRWCFWESELIFLFHMRIIWIYIRSHVSVAVWPASQLSCMAKTLTLDITLKIFSSKLFRTCHVQSKPLAFIFSHFLNSSGWTWWINSSWVSWYYFGARGNETRGTTVVLLTASKYFNVAMHSDICESI